MSDEQSAAMEALDAADAGSVEDSAGSSEQGVTGGDGGSDLPEFQDFTWKEGEKEYRFNRRAELADFLSNRTKTASETQKKAQERIQHFQKRMEAIEAERQAEKTAYGKWAQIDQAMRSNPQVAEAIQRAFQEARSSGKEPNIDRLKEELVKPLEERLTKYEQQEQRRQQELRRQQVLGKLKGDYEDFDESAIQAELNRLQETPDDQQERALYELMYYAMKGKTTPAQVERKFAEASSKRRPPSVTSTPGRGKGEVDPNSMSRSERAAMAERIFDQASR